MNDRTRFMQLQNDLVQDAQNETGYRSRMACRMLVSGLSEPAGVFARRALLAEEYVHLAIFADPPQSTSTDDVR